MKIINNLFPQDATNYQGSKIAFYGFALFLILMTWRSIIHMFFWETGLHDIANFIVLEGDPDPMTPIYLFFSLWGLQQVLTCLLGWIVLFRYRGLISIMIFIFALEWWIRLLYGNLGMLSIIPDYTDGVTPGSVGAPFLGILLLVLLFLSLKSKSV